MSTYDDWKCTPPEFYDDYDPQEDCDHTEYDVDFEGRAKCVCGKSWWLTAEEHEAYDRMMARLQDDFDREMRRSRFWCALRWLQSILRRTRQRLRRPQPIDDEIPF